MVVQQVLSNFIAGVGFDKEKALLRIVFKNGTYEDYAGMAESDFFAIRANPGREFNARIRGRVKPVGKGTWVF